MIRLMQPTLRTTIFLEPLEPSHHYYLLLSYKCQANILAHRDCHWRHPIWLQRRSRGGFLCLPRVKVGRCVCKILLFGRLNAVERSMNVYIQYRDPVCKLMRSQKRLPFPRKRKKLTYCSNLSVSSTSNMTFTRCVRSPIDPSIWALGFWSSL